MGHRKGSGRSSVYSTHSRRGTSIGGHPTSSPHRPLSHSSPLRQSSRPPRKIQWGNGGSRSNYGLNEDRPSPPRCVPRETGTLTWGESFGSVSKSPNSLSIGSDGGSSISSSNSVNSKYINTGGNKKPVARPSNPLRYKTELCRSFEENGECRFGTSCTFAHGLRELRAVLRHPRYKTDLCRTYHGAGYCQYGARCHFIHDPEEAAGVAAMRGHKLRIRPDGANPAMLALSENCNIASRVYANDLILANLQRLHAYKEVEKKIGFLNNSGYGSEQLNSIVTLSPRSNSMSFDMLTIGQDNLSGMASMPQPQGNFLGTSLDTPEHNSVEYSVGSESCGSRDSQVWRLSSLDWDREPEFITRCSLPELDDVPFSFARRSDTWESGEAPTQNKAVIGNPMEVSRSLLIPSITELIHMQ